VSCPFSKKCKQSWFENSACRIFKLEEEERGWRKLHKEELHNLYCSNNITGSLTFIDVPYTTVTEIVGGPSK
jgi:hypothetical protein